MDTTTNTEKSTSKTPATKTAYDTFLKKWPKEAGPKPTADQITAAETLGSRGGAKVTLALAMYLRDGGATNPEVIMAVGNPQLNKMRALAESGAVKKVPMAPKDGKTVYKIELKAAKAKAPSKPKAKKESPAKVPGEQKQDGGDGSQPEVTA